MIRTLMATTALAALMSTGAMAQEAAPATDAMAPATTEAPADPAMGTDAMAPATGDAMSTEMHTEAGDHDEMYQSFDLATGYTSVDTDNLATRLIDQPVYSSAGDDAEEIGNVTDLVFTEDGKISAVVIGVGGFLGIGEKSVAVDFASLEFTVATDNTERWVLPTTADELNNAPDFTFEDDKPADNMNTADGMTPADPAMAPADPAMAPADPAMAPADPAMQPADGAAAAMPRDGYERVDYEALTADNLEGATVIGPDGEDIAEVGDILLTEDGKIDAMVVDFGGFLGLGQKRVAVGMDNLEFAANEDGDYVIYSDFTREQLEAQPEYNEDTYASDPAQRATDM
ncbi:PRC-barrel domain-containing protein [Devosia neptuniae]|jgi:sporulation protein YlmC with PRC-barrel domain|uniref:PRC-barrel domain-containing protein n=1 Tax=Devosia TaxID=46913 RepID=UPI0022AEA418|nr:PRC-barrel domain-containing protein [Devosia neptuniae]MCZ4346658.1 PRC-barrel domain-containing protein [Devosia neptuniae]|tara:strand:+ start:5331 stop:6362 length:1032 start_codon:yes stop_codon:yes gene_type:complete